MKKKLPKSLRKYIRREKARIRREALGLKEQEKQIQELYQKIFKELKIKKTNDSANRTIIANALSTKL